MANPTQASELILTLPYRCIVEMGTEKTIVDEEIDYGLSTTITWRTDIYYGEDTDQDKVKKAKDEGTLEQNDQGEDEQ